MVVKCRRLSLDVERLHQGASCAVLCGVHESSTTRRLLFRKSELAWVMGFPGLFHFRPFSLRLGLRVGTTADDLHWHAGPLD